ncbi:MAG: Hpt domain-containing protein [Lachnospiraceae bacterium]|nr:Hpt domain-containing protein [Lachnospiraceae bacterium]
MDIREFFRQTEGSYEEAMGRFGSEALALRFIKKFPGDPSFEELKTALKGGQLDKAFEAAHALKGVCANLAFSKLWEAASRITEILRPGECKPEETGRVFREVEEDYIKVIHAIEHL